MEFRMQSRPSVSAILLCHNCDQFVAEAIRSVVEQEYDEPMEIIVSDDASTDDTVGTVERELARYNGPRRIRFSRRTTNSGSKSAHLNDVFPSASGDILISFDADDISERDRVRRIVERFHSDSNVQAVYSSYSFIDRIGRLRGVRKVPHPPSTRNTCAWFAQVDAYASGATLAVRRAVVERFGPLDPEIHEDIVLPFRASLQGEVAFIADPLVRVRRHAESLTASWERFGSIQDYRSWFLLGIEGARRNAQSRLADLRTAESMMPNRAEEFRALKSIVYESLSHAELTGRLMDPSISTRLSALIRFMRLGAYREDLFQHACIALMPGMYLGYKRHVLGVKRRRVSRG
jgi:glycosyltransferase involved in cell wall biosynthesis